MMMVDMISSPVLRMVDAVTVPVPDLDQGLAFYRDGLGHKLIWRNDEIRQAGLRLPDGETEIVLSEHQPYAPNWLVSSVSEYYSESLSILAGTVRRLGSPRLLPRVMGHRGSRLLLRRTRS